MYDLKELGKLMKEHPIIIVVTLAGMVVGAIFRAVAFYQGCRVASCLGRKYDRIKKRKREAFIPSGGME